MEVNYIMSTKKALEIFISQPMNGLTESEIYHNRNSVILNLPKILNVKNITIRNALIKYDENADTKYDKKMGPIGYLGKSIQEMDGVDVAIFLEGWEKARGCVIEHKVAKEYHIPQIYIYDNFSKSFTKEPEFTEIKE